MTTKTQAAPDIRERVTAGAAWLDQHRPGWLNRIDLITLDVSDPECCPIGQEYGTYDDRPADLRNGRREAALGFYAPPTADGRFRPSSDVADEYAALTEAWKTHVLDAAACCPCTGVICDPGCICPDCPKSETELTDD